MPGKGERQRETETKRERQRGSLSTGPNLQPKADKAKQPQQLRRRRQEY